VKDLIVSRLDSLDHKVYNLLENDTSLLQGVVDLAGGLNDLVLEVKSIQQQSEAIQLAVKDLIVSRLDSLDHKVSNLLENDTSLLQGLDSLDHKVSNLLENDTSLLQGVVDLGGGLNDLVSEVKFIQQQSEAIQLAVKDLVVSRLDSLDHKISNLLENDTSLLQGVVDLGGGLNDLALEIKSIQQQSEAIQQQSEAIQQAYQLIRPKAISSSDSDPETRLMAYLYSHLPNRCAVDVGANIGDVSAKLLEVGYEVYAFEPFPEVFEKLKCRFSASNQFHSYPVAIGSIDETRNFFLAQDQTEENIYKDSSLYNSLTKHSMPGDMVFNDSITVPVRSLESLHTSGELPEDIGLVKVDTEGFDLEVLRGMGSHRYPVVVAEFWDAQFPFGLSEAFNRLDAMVGEMKTKGYYWHLVIYRVWGSDEVLFYCNHPESIEKSWGNVFFFQEYSIFSVAAKWCSSVLREAHFM
jgi:FkbM family methyltransferase